MLLKLRFYMRLFTAFVGRFKALLFVGILSGFFIFILLRFFIPFYFSHGTERIGLTGRYHVIDLPEEVLNYIGSGLTSVDSTGIVKDAMAESWSESESGKVWTFKIKGGINWHDGDAVTSDTISYSFNDVSIQRPDNKTIVFKLKNSFSPFPAALSKPVFKKGLIGTGEWRVKKISLAGEYVQEIVLTNSEKDKKIYKFYPTDTRTKTALKLGGVDKIEDMIDPYPFDKWGTVDVSKNEKTDRYVGVFFNYGDKVVGGTENKSLRQALSYAIDKSAFNARRAISPISPDSWAFNPQAKSYDYDKEHALTLLKDIPEEDRKNMEIRLATTPALLPIAEIIATYWRNIGVKTVVQVSSILPSEFQAFLAIYDIPADPDQYATWHSTQGETNISRYNNPRIDKLLEDGRLKVDQNERKKIYLDFQRFLLEDAPAIFLYHPISYSISRK